MEPTAAQIMEAVHTVDDKATELLADAARRQDLAAAVADGIKAAVSDPELWAAAGVAMKKRAQQEAGGWLFGGFRAVLSRLAWIVMIGAGVYYLGGWTALFAFFKTSHP